MNENSLDFDEQMDADLLKSANDYVRRALDDAAAGETISGLAKSAAASFAIAGVVGFVVGAIFVKVLR